MQESPDRDISLITINNEKELARYNADALSHELTGKPIDRMFPIYLVFHHGKCRGYFHAIQQCVIYPAIHAEMMHADEYQKIMYSLIKEIKRAAGNPLFLVCKRASKFSRDALRKMGVRKCENEAYEYCDQSED